MKEFLKNFRGVLVSDFYSAYDAIECPQQKCLIHLIRDFNEDLQKNAFDEEFKNMARAFTLLLRTIVGSIDKYGLKRRHLRKHKRDAERYFVDILRKKYTSEPARKYQKRFEKNKGKLFTLSWYISISILSPCYINYEENHYIIKFHLEQL